MEHMPMLFAGAKPLSHVGFADAVAAKFRGDLRRGAPTRKPIQAAWQSQHQPSTETKASSIVLSTRNVAVSFVCAFVAAGGKNGVFGTHLTSSDRHNSMTA
jgi:hypothetical protein